MLWRKTCVPAPISFEIAIGLRELETNHDPVAQDETIQFLKVNLLKY
jgi:hypothetical protein